MAKSRHQTWSDDDCRTSHLRDLGITHPLTGDRVTSPRDVDRALREVLGAVPPPRRRARGDGGWRDDPWWATTAPPPRDPATRELDHAPVHDPHLPARIDHTTGHHARLLPYRAAAATAGAGTGAWGAAELTTLAAGTGAGALVALGAGATTAVATAGWWAAHRHNPVLRRWSCRAAAAAAGASTWVGATAATGPGWWSAAVLAAGTAVLSAGWWRAHAVPDIPTPPAPVAPAPVVLEVEDVGDFAIRWGARVARKGGKVPGSWLTDGAEFAHGIEFTLHLDGGMTRGQVQARTDEIASALGCDPGQLVLDDAPPDAAGWRPADRCILRFVTRSPVAATVEHTGPTYADGHIDLGPYIDGEGTAQWRIFTENSMWSGIVIGGTGSGKSALVNGLLTSARASGMVTTLYFDAKRNSSPALAAAATVATLGLEDAGAFTRGVEQLLRGRQLESAALGLDGFTPSPGRQGYIVVLDECDLLFALPGMAERWANIAKTGRALGIALLGMTQVANVSLFGGNDLLRSSLAAGNVAMLRVATGGSGGMVTPDMPSPKGLPREPGYGHLATAGSRPVPFRARRLRSVADCEREGLGADSWNVATALAAHPDQPLDRVGVVALADLLLAADPEERAAAQREQAATALAEFLGAPTPPAGGATPAAPADATGRVVDVAAGRWGAAPSAAGIFTARPAPEVAGPDPRAEAEALGLAGNQAAVWALLPTDGSEAATGDLARTAEREHGVRRDTVSKTLAALERKGHAARGTARGTWQRAGATAGARGVA